MGAIKMRFMEIEGEPDGHDIQSQYKGKSYQDNSMRPFFHQIELIRKF